VPPTFSALDGTGANNDFDIDSTTFTSITITGLGSNGTLQLNGVDVGLNAVITAAQLANGELTFVPAADFNGDASFKYTVSDGTLSSNEATVTINIAGANDAPVAVDDTLSGTEDTVLTISAADLFGADGTGANNDF
jgi:large repetitive protein